MARVERTAEEELREEAYAGSPALLTGFDRDVR
jgi:hypothetical protein